MTEFTASLARVAGLLALPGLLMFTAGCTQVVELNGTIPDAMRAAPYPDLVPVERLVANGPAPSDEAEQIAAELRRRGNRVRARADRLRRDD